MDAPTFFSEDSTSTAGSTPVDDATSTADDSAVINTDALLDTADDASVTTTASATTPTGQIGDPLAGVDDPSASANPVVDDKDDDIVPNETITTNDWSKVGEVKPNEPPAEELPTAIIPPQPAKEPESEVPQELETSEIEIPPFASELKYKGPGVDDPEKIAFVKTYTEEFDDALIRATNSAQNILDAIDKAIHEHSPDITVPDSAEEFLAKKIPGNKVEKFDDARDIVREVLARAADAKAQAAKAAEEAARIYDEVQAFKKETEDQIAVLTTEQ